MKSVLLTVISTVGFVFLFGCDSSSGPVKPVDKLALKAQAAAERSAEAAIEPHEIKNIARRRVLMGKPGLQLYVTFFNEMGQPIEYFVTDGKCSSSNKRLTKPYELVEGDKGSYTGVFVVPAGSEDGTNGKSDDYIYCKAVNGVYKQWNGEVYITDAPMKPSAAPLVIEKVVPETEK